MGIKIGLLLLNNLTHYLDLDSLLFDSDIKSTFTLNYPDAIRQKLDIQYWKEVIGSEAWDKINCSNVLFEINFESSDPEIQNHENEELLEKARLIWYALRLLTPVHVTGAFIASGYLLNNKIRITHYQMLPNWCMPEELYCQGEEITKNRIDKWKKIYHSLKSTWKQKKSDKKYERFWRGIKCFQKACDELYAPWRFPNFVRSIEALIIPEINKTTARFTSRPTKWWPNDWNPKIFSGAASEALCKIYQIRCDLDHLHDPNVDDHDFGLRSYQVQQIARKAFQDILLNDDEVKCFSSDDEIYKYWNQGDRHFFGGHAHL